MREPALMAFGYSRREAAWLEQVILHAGVFLRRQYLEFIGHRRRGAVDQRLPTRLATAGDVRVWPYHRKERLYHVTAMRENGARA